MRTRKVEMASRYARGALGFGLLVILAAMACKAESSNGSPSPTNCDDIGKKALEALDADTSARDSRKKLDADERAVVLGMYESMRHLGSECKEGLWSARRHACFTGARSTANFIRCRVATEDELQ